MAPAAAEAGRSSTAFAPAASSAQPVPDLESGAGRAAWSSAWGGSGEGDGITPCDCVHGEGSMRVLRFREPQVRCEGRCEGRPPVVLVPSLINRWYVLDLRPGASLVQALLAAGLDVFVVDWGVPGDEDRYLGWDDVIARLRRALRAVRRRTGCERIGLLGYCMGATVCGIHAAREQAGQGGGPRDGLTGFVNLLGPFDFARAGALTALTDPRWFDPEAVALAGNVAPDQMQAGFTALRPTLALAKWVGVLDRWGQPGAFAAFRALETWASDNVPFPGAAYATYVRDLYQRNALVRGEHHVAGERVDLGRITCPVLTVCAARDTICPPDAATALNDCCGAQERTVLRVAGGHVGAVVGGRAARDLYPAIGAFFLRHAGARSLSE